MCLDQNLIISMNKDYTILPKVTSFYSNIINTKYFLHTGPMLTYLHVCLKLKNNYSDKLL